MHCAICPLDAVAFHFFTSWHLDLERQPSLATSQEWFNLKFAPGRRGPAKEITYNSHLEAMKKCLGSLRMSSAAKTQIDRGSGARMAELDEATEGGIRWLGRWNSQALAGCYLTSLPRPALRTMAGFPPERGYFHIIELQWTLYKFYSADYFLGMTVTVMIGRVGKGLWQHKGSYAF